MLDGCKEGIINPKANDQRYIKVCLIGAMIKAYETIMKVIKDKINLGNLF